MSYIEYVTADHHFEDRLPDLARANRFTMADLEMNRNGKVSDTQWMRLFVASDAPGIFTYTADGKGAGAITHVNGSAVTMQSPAQPGELLIFYATGLG